MHTTSVPDHINAWEKDYQKRGALWRGTTGATPILAPGQRVLELGCGNGKTAVLLSVQPGLELYAMDASPTAVTMCQQRITQAGGKATLAVADGTALPYPNEFFDTIIAFHYLAHMPQLERNKAAQEILRVLRPTGRIYFKEFGIGDFRCGKGTEVEPHTYRRHTGILTHYFSETELLTLFAGTQIEKLEFERWRVKLRGTIYPREMIHAVFTKEQRA